MNPDIPSFQPPSARDASVENRVLSVSSLNRLARGLLEDCFPAVSVEGEISNLAVPGSGHWYLTLKDDGAQIRCAMFRNRNTSVRFRPTNGMQVVVRGKLSVYEGRGDYQLILDSMQDAGAGALQRAFDELKNKLAREGLFDAALKQPLPAHCRHVAVITSPTGAVIRDIISVFRRRYPAMRVTVFPVAVQGQESAPAIIQALQNAQRRQQALGIDVVLLARGGGSLEDLQSFNDESVARAIHACTLPVVSAVGHETDTTIADFVADLRAPTPSAAAELLSPDQIQLRMALQHQHNKLVRLMQNLLNQRSQQLDWLRKRLQHPGRRLQEQTQALTQLDSRLQRAMLRFLEQRRGHLQMLARNLENISPLQTLQRGYSITRTPDGKLISTSSQVKAGDDIISTLATGQIVSTIKEIKA
jgi:exodeoxyribonuclease VII large subunit